MHSKGDWWTDGLSPFQNDGLSVYNTATMASNDSSAYFTGVTALSGFFHDRVVLSPGSTEHANWSDGEPLLASKGNVIGVNFFPVDSPNVLSNWHPTGDYQQLFINAITDDLSEGKRALRRPRQRLRPDIGGRRR